MLPDRWRIVFVKNSKGLVGTSYHELKYNKHSLPVELTGAYILHSGKCEHIHPVDIYLEKICMLNRDKFCLLMRVICVTKHLGTLTSQEAVKLEERNSSKF
jgi:hypothetical protein